MKKVLIFPLNEDTELLVQNRRRCKNYFIEAVSSYYEDKERLGRLRDKSQIYCNVDFKACLQRVDAVIFAENTMERTYLGYESRVKAAIDSGKEVIMSETLLNKLDIDGEKENVCVLQQGEIPEMPNEVMLKDITIPIISVIGSGKNCDKFRLQIKAAEIIESKGYKVLSVCSNFLGNFLDMQILPGFLFLKNLSLPSKIETFNFWLYNLQKQSNADVIVLGCPGGIMPFNDFEYNFFGEISLAIHNAVVVDYTLFTLYRNCHQTEETMKRLNHFCEIKYNTIAESFIMSQQYYSADYERKKVNYYSDKEYNNLANKCITHEIFSICNIEEEKNIENMLCQILEKLKNNLFVI